MNVNGKLSCDTFGDYLNVNGNAPNDLLYYIQMVWIC